MKNKKEQKGNVSFDEDWKHDKKFDVEEFGERIATDSSEKLKKIFKEI